MTVIYGTKGADSLSGGTGNDTIHAGPSLNPGTDKGNDTLIGGAGRDSLVGYDGDDVLEGGVGTDTLVGGGGNDVYFNPSGDTIDESTGSGTDTVVTDAAVFSINTIAGIENLTGISASAQTLFGSAGDNVITGGVGNDTLNGLGGNNTLDGGAGADRMSASTGNDIYVVDNVGDTVVEGFNQGTDTILTSLASYGLGDNLENLTGIGATGQSLTGNSLANVLTGNSGDDTLQGGGGNDSLLGECGTDRVVFSGARDGYLISDGIDGRGRYTEVKDIVPAGGNDGTDRLYDVEVLQFADATQVICFYPGTMVATPAGEVAVETLAAGDLVLTSEGQAEPVRWMGRQTVSTTFADPLRVLPIRIRAGALAEGLPQRDLLVSPDHALLVDGVLVQAGALVNGTTIARERAVPTIFTYHHVELASHALILAEGVPAETFVDNIDRLAFDNWAEHEALHGNLPTIVELDLPRAKSARQVPMATRRRLAALAAQGAEAIAA